MTDNALLNQIIDLKVGAAAREIMAELKKLADAHNHVAQTVLPPLVADLERRTAAEVEQEKDARIAAQAARIAELEALLGGQSLANASVSADDVRVIPRAGTA